MKHLLKTAAFAALVATGAAGTVAIPAMAQDTGPIVPGLAVINLDYVVASSNAFKAAASQRPTVYKAQIDQAQARKSQIEGQLNPLIEKFNKDRAANAPQATLAQEYQTIQGIQQSGQQEIQRILQPAAYSEAYVNEQIEGKLDDAIKAAMNKKKISILLKPDSIAAASGAYNISQDVLTELNTLIPSAQLQPPAGWEPREVREQRQQQAAQAGQAAPAGKPAQGR
jgi:Skp family chaperone for outer membrane proteins